MHTFVDEFPGQVLSHCWLLGATGMRTLRGLYHSIPLGERTPMRPFPTPADICPLRYLPLHPADLYSHADTSKPIPFDSPRPADSNGPCPNAVRPLVEWLCLPLYLSSPGKHFSIVGYWVLQACERFEAYTIQFPLPRGIQRTLSGHYPTAGLRVIHTFVF